MSELGSDRRAARLLLVDSDADRRALLAGILAQDGYGTVRGCAGLDGVGQTGDQPTADLVLLDLDAPGTTVDSVVAMISAMGTSSPVPILGFTSDDTAGGRQRAARIGVSDFAVRPVGQDELRLRVDAALEHARLRRRLDEPESPSFPFPNPGGSDLDTIRESLSVLTAITDYHDDDSHQHAQRVGVTAAAIARALELPESFVTMLRDAAPQHDIGKVGISRRILLKPEKLTPPEWLHMMSHVDVGEKILASAQSPVFVLAAEIARTHHERWDGSGYTAGLRGEEIPVSGRIVAVAVVWDTLTHLRPYRPAWAPERARAEIHAQSGSHFDPTVVAAFTTLGPRDLAPDDDALARTAD